MRYAAVRYQAPLFGRFVGKLVDVLPAALASALGGFLFTHFEAGRAPEPLAVRAAPASAEMMQLLRDEHSLMASFLKTKLADQKNQLAAERDAARKTADAQPVMAVPQPAAIITAAPKAATPRAKAPGAGAAVPPLVIAQARLDDGAQPAAGNNNSLLAKTMGLKDNVVAVTHRVVSTIGGIPSWIGERFGATGASSPTGAGARPPAQLVSAS